MKRVLLTVCFAALCLGQQNQSVRGRGWWTVSAVSQTSEGHVRHLRGHAEVSSTDVMFRADLIDYDEDRGMMHLSGHVTIEAKNKSALSADEADYNVNSGDLSLKIKLTPTP